MEREFITPPDHFGFRAAKLFGAQGELLDGSLAVIEPGGGGPRPAHTHPQRDHLFYVISGEMRIQSGDETTLVRAGEYCRVPGALPHTTDNPGDCAAEVLGLTLGG
ncbi:MAG: cupin domain-containing protein [Eubacteriales bacterium]|nr:cupin domain-containing protein [Eubacteriales bacterium]